MDALYNLEMEGVNSAIANYKCRNVTSAIQLVNIVIEIQIQGEGQCKGPATLYVTTGVDSIEEPFEDLNICLKLGGATCEPWNEEEPSIFGNSR